jgi:hypothetical protein
VAIDRHCNTIALTLLQRIIEVKTGSFRTYTGPGRISIARWAPRRTPAGYRIYNRLAPGPWFNSVGIEEYCHLYSEILKELDPKRVYAELVALVAPEEPVLLCWEVPPFTAPRPIPQAGLTMIGRSNWCHRRLAAVWFKQTLGIDVPELELPGRQPGLQLSAPARKGPASHIVPRPGLEPDAPVVL